MFPYVISIRALLIVHKVSLTFHLPFVFVFVFVLIFVICFSEQIFILEVSLYLQIKFLFVVLLAENGRLRNIDTISKRFVELTMAHKGIVKVIVTSVIVSYI